MLIGKTQSSIRALNNLFENKKISKTYYAVTIGKMNREGTITEPVDEKTAHTSYKVIASVFSEKYESLNLVKLQPQTGRRHQLRKHLSGIGHPILGDRDYGQEGLILKGKGIYLHAYALEFDHPITHETKKITDPIPDKFNKLFPNQSL